MQGNEMPKGVLEQLSQEGVEVWAAYKYLSNLPMQMFGEFHISDPRRRLQAAIWLGRHYLGVDRVLRNGDPKALANRD